MNAINNAVSILVATVTNLLPALYLSTSCYFAYRDYSGGNNLSFYWSLSMIFVFLLLCVKQVSLLKNHGLYWFQKTTRGNESKLMMVFLLISVFFAFINLIAYIK